MDSVVALDRRTPAMRWREVRDEAALWGELRPELAAAVKAIVEGTMEDELTVLLAARPYERTAGRTGYRNGAFARRLTTELGAIDVRVPRARALAYQPSFLERAARRTAGVDRVLRRAFLRGLSVRETAALAGELTGVPLSAAAVSRLVVRLDAQVAAFHHRPLAFPARSLVLDGLWVFGAPEQPTRRTAGDPGGLRDRCGRPARTARLPPGGLRVDGRVGPPLGFPRGAGPRPRRAAPRRRRWRRGIREAVAEAFPDVPFGRCWTHRLRNLPEALPLCERRVCLRGLRAVYRASSRRAAVAAYWRWARTWRRRHPRLVAALERDLDELLAVFALPAPLRASLRTTNLIERAFRELRRRLRSIGVLADRGSADRILYGQVIRLNELLARRPLVAFTQEA